jgi:hypothetical protein
LTHEGAEFPENREEIGRGDRGDSGRWGMLRKVTLFGRLETAGKVRNDLPDNQLQSFAIVGTLFAHTHHVHPDSNPGFLVLIN